MGCGCSSHHPDIREPRVGSLVQYTGTKGLTERLCFIFIIMSSARSGSKLATSFFLPKQKTRVLATKGGNSPNPGGQMADE